MLAILNSDECKLIQKCVDINQNISSLHTNIHFNNVSTLLKYIFL